MKLLFILISFLVLFIYSFFNLGYFLDVTQSPTKSDLIVCLGGGDNLKKIEKTIKLQKENYLKSNTIIFTGTKEVKDIEKKLDENINIIIEPTLTNTAQEVKYIKEYMIEHDLSSVLIVADPAQSRRISILKEVFKVKNDENLSFKIVSNDYNIWDSKYYYKNNTTRRYAFSEVVKIVYNVFIYKLINDLGLLDIYYTYFYDYVKENKGIVFEYQF